MEGTPIRRGMVVIFQAFDTTVSLIQKLSSKNPNSKKNSFVNQ
jgi:hypothetical protein